MEDFMNRNMEEGIPTIDTAMLLLEEARNLFPGLWVEHSIYAGKAAELIAQNCKELFDSFLQLP